MEWFSEHWQYVMAAFYAAEKLVKLSKTDKDDILVDWIGKGLLKFVKKS